MRMDEDKLRQAIEVLGEEEVLSMAVLSQYDDEWCDEHIAALHEVRELIVLLYELEKDNHHIRKKRERMVTSIDELVNTIERQRDNSVNAQEQVNRVLQYSHHNYL